MQWPEAIYKIITEGGEGLLVAIIVLAAFTNFFENLFNRGKATVEVEVIPDSIVSDLEDVISEMRGCAGSCGATNLQLIEWAKTIDETIHE
jgi:hypothetical protein